jgi:hypothetical protein
MEYGQQTCYRSQEGNTLDQRRSQDHVLTNLTGCFRLAGNAFNGALTYLSDTDTGPDRGQTCADRAKAGLCNIC